MKNYATKIRPLWWLIITSILAGSAIDLIRLSILLHHHDKVDLPANLFSSVATMVLVFIIQFNHQRRKIYRRYQLTILAQATREIRDALTVMLKNCTPNTKEEYLLTNASKHIEWTLQSLLPQIDEYFVPPEIESRVKSEGTLKLFRR